MIKDKDIRYKYILENKEFFKQGIFLNEYDINCKNRIDFALFKDGTFIGYEIKSEADNLKRFIPQLRTYLRFFNFLYLIVHRKHSDEVYRLLKLYKLDKIGIILVGDDISFLEDRKALPDNSINKLNSLLRNLKNEDLINLCKVNKIKYFSNVKEALVARLIGKITIEEVLRYLTNRLTATYVSLCPHCKSNLTFKTHTLINKNISEKKVNPSKKMIKNTFWEIKISVKISRCIECGYEFNHHEGTEISRILKSTEETKL